MRWFRLQKRQRKPLERCDVCKRHLDPQGHTYGEYTSDNGSTCITYGTKTRICSVCKHSDTFTDTDSHLTSTKHNVATDKGVEPTYSSSGLTEGSHCRDSREILVRQTEIPPLEDDVPDLMLPPDNGPFGTSGKTPLIAEGNKTGEKTDSSEMTDEENPEKEPEDSPVISE